MPPGQAAARHPRQPRPPSSLCGAQRIAVRAAGRGREDPASAGPVRRRHRRGGRPHAQAGQGDPGGHGSRAARGQQGRPPAVRGQRGRGHGERRGAGRRAASWRRCPWAESRKESSSARTAPSSTRRPRKTARCSRSTPRARPSSASSRSRPGRGPSPSCPTGRAPTSPARTATPSTVVDARRHAPLKTIALTGENARPMGAVAAPDGRFVYVTTGRGRNGRRHRHRHRQAGGVDRGGASALGHRHLRRRPDPLHRQRAVQRRLHRRRRDPRRHRTREGRRQPLGRRRRRLSRTERRAAPPAVAHSRSGRPLHRTPAPPRGPRKCLSMSAIRDAGAVAFFLLTARLQRGAAWSARARRHSNVTSSGGVGGPGPGGGDPRPRDGRAGSSSGWADSSRARQSNLFDDVNELYTPDSRADECTATSCPGVQQSDWIGLYGGGGVQLQRRCARSRWAFSVDGYSQEIPTSYRDSVRDDGERDPAGRCSSPWCRSALSFRFLPLDRRAAVQPYLTDRRRPLLLPVRGVRRLHRFLRRQPADLVRLLRVRRRRLRRPCGGGAARPRRPRLRDHRRGPLPVRAAQADGRRLQPQRDRPQRHQRHHRRPPEVLGKPGGMPSRRHSPPSRDVRGSNLQ